MKAKNTVVKSILAFLFTVAVLAGATACGPAKNNNPETLSTSGGYTVEANSLTLEFDQKCYENERKQILKDYDLKVASHDKLSGVYIVELDHNADAQELISLKNELNAHGQIIKADYVYVGNAPGVFW